jgi:hypothetical protein
MRLHSAVGHLENIRNLPRNMRRLREIRRKRLTRGERTLGWTLALGPGVLVVIAVALLLFDQARAVGIALLIVALVVIAVPISPLLGAKARWLRSAARSR